MNAPAANLPAERRELAPIEVLKNTVARKADDFKMVLPSHITVDKFQRTIATAALSNPTLLGCDRQSLLIAAMKLAQDGLLPDGREAALVPFKSWNKETRETTWQVQPMPMAWGLRKKILQSGQVVSLETGLVYRAELESGHFLYEIGIDPPIRHRPKLDLTAEETADSEIVAAYSIARLKSENGDPYWSVEVMRRSEIDKVRQASQTGAVGRKMRDGKPITPKGPWVDWYGEMARKTVLRRHSKVLPMSGDIFETIERDTEEELRAAGAARLLAEQVDGPVALPSNDQLDAAGADDDHDPETGEILDSRGMTEVDEETARALDTADSQEEDGQGEEGPDPKPIDPHYGKPYAEKRREVLDALNLAASHDDVQAAQSIAKRHAKHFPAEVKAEINEAYAKAVALHPSLDEGGDEGGAEGADGSAGEEAPSEPGADNAPAWTAKVNEIRGGIRNAKTVSYLNSVDEEYGKQRAALPDDIVEELDAAFTTRRRELRDAGK